MKINIILQTIIVLFILSCADKQEKSSASETITKSTYFDDSTSNDQKTTSTSFKENVSPIFTPSPLPYPFSSAVQVGDILYLSGEIGDAGNGVGLVPGGIEPETHRMFERIQATLANHGLGLEDVFKCTVMLADMSEWSTFNAIYATYFKKGKYPTRSAMGVNGLALGARVEMECWAWNPQKN